MAGQANFWGECEMQGVDWGSENFNNWRSNMMRYQAYGVETRAPRKVDFVKLNKTVMLQSIGYYMECATQLQKEFCLRGDAKTIAKIQELMTLTDVYARKLTRVKEAELWELNYQLPGIVPEWFPMNVKSWLARKFGHTMPLIYAVVGIVDYNLGVLDSGMQISWVAFPEFNIPSVSKGTRSDSVATTGSFCKIAMKDNDEGGSVSELEYVKTEEAEILDLVRRLAERKLRLNSYKSETSPAGSVGSNDAKLHGKEEKDKVPILPEKQTPFEIFSRDDCNIPSPIQKWQGGEGL